MKLTRLQLAIDYKQKKVKEITTNQKEEVQSAKFVRQTFTERIMVREYFIIVYTPGYINPIERRDGAFCYN